MTSPWVVGSMEELEAQLVGRLRGVSADIVVLPVVMLQPPVAPAPAVVPAVPAPTGTGPVPPSTMSLPAQLALGAVAVVCALMALAIALAS